MAELDQPVLEQPTVAPIKTIESAEYKAAQTAAGTQPPVVPTPETPEGPKVQETPPQVDTWKEFSGKVGFEVTEEQVIADLKLKKEFENKFNESKSKYDALSPIALDIDRATKSGLDLDLYLDARKMDVEKLGAYASLEKMYFLSHPEVYATDPDFAREKFRRDYEVKFGLLTQKLDPVEAEQKKTEIDFLDRQLKVEHVQAKKFLSEFKVKNTTIPDAPKPEDNQKIVEQYQQQAQEFVTDLGSLDIPVGDEVFTYSLEPHLGEIEAAVKDPIGFLALHGIDIVKGTADAKKFGEMVTKLLILENLSKPLAVWASEQGAAKVVKQKLDGPAPTQTLAGGVTPEKTTDQKVAEAIVADREAKRQGRR